MSEYITSRPSRHELAFHEAGHAVVAALLGQRLLCVRIDEANGGSGEAEPDNTSPFSHLDEPLESRRRIVIAMAGTVAQCLAIGSVPHWMPASKRDKELAEDNAERAGIAPNDFSVVIAILTQPQVWEKVERLAAALLRHGQLHAWDTLNEFLPAGDPKVYETAGIAAALVR